MAWEFKREEQNFSIIPEGVHRVRIDEAERQVSKSGKDMIKLTLAVSGYNSHLFHYIVFLPDRPEITNRNLTQLFDSFTGIKPGDCNEVNWVGKVGAAKVKHEEYNGDMVPRVGYFIKASKAKNLPAWQEPENSDKPPVSKPAPGAAGEAGFVEAGEEDLPIW